MSSDDEETRVITPEDRTLLVAPEEASTFLRAGDVLRDRFEVDKILGEGGMGRVFLARDRQAEKSNPFVALKLLSENFKDHPKAYAALRREAMQSRQLNHPNLINVYDFDRQGDHVYMVMEFLKGQPLDEVIAVRQEGSDLKEIWPIIEGAGNGLTYVHERNIIHADFKPSNVFVTENAEVKVLDLGIARTLDENVGDGTTRFDPDALGALTPQYASCEMFEGLPPSAQDDLFALACVAYELLTGKHPYQRRTALEARADRMEVARPKGLKSRQWKALKSGLAFARADRPATVEDFLREISPEGKSGSPLPWIIATAVVAAIAVGVFVMAPSGVSEDELVLGILDDFPITDDVRELHTEAQLKNDFDGGDFWFSMGMDAIAQSPPDYAKAEHFFLSPASSARNSYAMAMRFSEDTEVRRRAAMQMLAIAREYEKDAERLLDEDADPALIGRVLCTGLSVARTPGLAAMYADVEAEGFSLMTIDQCKNLNL